MNQSIANTFIQRIMRSSRSILAAAVATLGFSLAVGAQTTTQTGVGKGGSPHVKSTWSIGGANVAIEYGRPYLKGRAESALMPAGKPWRTGADEATVITIDQPLVIGTLKLAAGSYTLNTVPGPKTWELLVGKLGKPGQWGVPYDTALEIGRVPMKLDVARVAAEQVTYSIDTAPTGGVLRIEWGTQSASVPFVVGKQKSK